MYIRDEQPNTSFNLTERVQNYNNEKNNDILVEFDAAHLTQENFKFIPQLSDMLKDSGEIGEMEFDIFKITINRLKTYEKELIKCER
jgi:cytochrome c oxidase assembly protein Cox11